MVITDDTGATAPLRDELYELVRELDPVAERMGCADDLCVVSDVLEYGASYERQRAIITSGELTDVVDAVATEFAEARFVAPGEVTYAGR